MKNTFWSVGLLGAVVMLARPVGAQTIIAYDLPTPVTGQQNFAPTVGLDFTVNSPVVIQSLGVFNSAVGGVPHSLVDSFITTIYNRNTQNAVPGLSVTFSSSSPGTLSGGNLFKPVGGAFGITLAPGNYTLASTGFVGTNKLGYFADPGFTPDQYHDGGGLLTINTTQYRYNENLAGNAGVDKYPVNVTNGQLNAGSLTFAAVSTTPEPGTISLLLGLGTAGVGAGFRLRRRRRVARKG